MSVRSLEVRSATRADVPAISALQRASLVETYEPFLGRILLADVRRVAHVGPVDAAQGVTIGCPGIPRGGAFPPSQAFTVAPTSANSP